jgi:hypothetical protein
MADYPKTLTLPSGRTATLTRKMKVRDMVFAHRVVGATEADNTIAIGIAAMAPTIELDNKPVVYEDLLELDLDDIAALGEVADDKTYFKIAGDR